MNTLELSKVIGLTGTIQDSRRTLHYGVRIVNARTMWNRVDYLVVPISGSGESWVDSASVTLLNLTEETI